MDKPIPAQPPRALALILILAVALVAPACSSTVFGGGESEVASPELAGLLETSTRTYTTTQPVLLRVNIYPLWTGEGATPSSAFAALPLRQYNDGELNTIWFVESADDFRQTIVPDEIEFGISYDGAYAPFHSESFLLQPNGGIESLHIKVFDRDRFGNQRAEELTNFLTSLGRAGSQQGLVDEGDIPILTDIFKLAFIDLPNLFLDNENLGEFRLNLHRESQALSFELGYWVHGYTLFEVVAFELPEPDDDAETALIEAIDAPRVALLFQSLNDKIKGGALGEELAAKYRGEESKGEPTINLSRPEQQRFSWGLVSGLDGAGSDEDEVREAPPGSSEGGEDDPD